jgi:hypothetical protein
MLGRGATCTIYVQFTPASKGPKSGSVKLSDNARFSPQFIPLSGSGI